MPRAVTPEVSSDLFALRQALCEALQNAFDVPFTLWLTAEAREPACHGSLPDEQDQRRIVSALQVVTAPAAAVVVPVEQGQVLVVPVVGGKSSLLAAGLVAQQDANLVCRLANTILGSLKQGHDLAAANARLEEYALQVTNDFEELTWLRKLVQHLDFGNISRDIQAVAQAILPSLRQLIDAEALMLFDVKHQKNHPIAGELLFRDGGSPGKKDEAVARDAIERLAEVSSRQPAVLNATRSKYADGSDGIRNAVLVRIARAGQPVGWLLALNKSHCSRQSEKAASHDKAVQGPEFGTFEAGLLSAAAAILAMYSRPTISAGVLNGLVTGDISQPGCVQETSSGVA